MTGVTNVKHFHLFCVPHCPSNNFCVALFNTYQQLHCLVRRQIMLTLDLFHMLLHDFLGGCPHNIPTLCGFHNLYTCTRLFDDIHIHFRYSSQASARQTNHRVIFPEETTNNIHVAEFQIFLL